MKFKVALWMFFFKLLFLRRPQIVLLFLQNPFLKKQNKKPKQLDNIFLCSFLSHQGICQSHPYKDFGIYRAAIHCHLLQSGSGADSSLSPIPSAILPLHWKGNVTFSRKHTKTVDRRCKLWQRPITWNVFFFFHTVNGTCSFILSYTVRI